MFKKKWKSVFIVILVIVIAFISVFCVFLVNRYKQYNSINLLDKQNDVKIQKEILFPDVDYENFIQSVQNDIKIVLVTVNGKYYLAHDKTKQSNRIFEWFSISKIELNCDYSVCFVIDTNNLEFSQEEDGLKVYYSGDDIYINSLTITNSIASEIKALFGRSYSTDEIFALQDILKEQIIEESKNEKNIQKAKMNLNLYLYEVAKTCNVEIKVCDKDEALN